MPASRAQGFRALRTSADVTCLGKHPPAENRSLLLETARVGCQSTTPRGPTTAAPIGASPCHRHNTGPLCSGLSKPTSPKNKVGMLFCCEKTMHTFLKLSAHSWGGGGRGKTDVGAFLTEPVCSFQPLCALSTHSPLGKNIPAAGKGSGLDPCTLGAHG